MNEESIEEWRKYINFSIENKAYRANISTNESNELNELIQAGKLNDKNHLFSTDNRFTEYDLCCAKCLKCNIVCSFMLNIDNEIIVYNRTGLSCEERIIKNIIE